MKQVMPSLICLAGTPIPSTKSPSSPAAAPQVTHCACRSRSVVCIAQEFLDDIAMSLGGYVAEKYGIRDITTGASNDLQVSTAWLGAWIHQYACQTNVGPIALESAQGAYCSAWVC